MSISPNQSQSQVVASELPPLTPENIQRAQEGLADARNRAVQRSIQKGLNQLDAIAQGKFEHRLSGHWRHWILRLLIRSLFDVRVECPENIPHDPVILVSNHLNHIDPFLLLSEVPAYPYYYIFGDSRSLYNKSWKRWILGLSGGVIPLERRWGEEIAVIEGAKNNRRDLIQLAKAIEKSVPSGSDFKTLRQIDRAVRSILSRQDGIILFPEGRLGMSEGQLTVPLKRGTALYALRSGFPVVPVALVGTQRLYFRKTLTLRFGKPLFFPKKAHPTHEEIEAVLERLVEAFQALLPSDYQDPNEPQPFADCLNKMFC